jgi:hypothetical protein
MHDPISALTPAPPPEPAAKSIGQRLLEALHRYRYWLAPLSFGAGLASFILIERREYLAKAVSVLLVVGWLMMIAEEAAARALRLSPAVLRYGVQAIQQETFFFTLPFFLHTTTWGTGQAVFTGAAIVAALCSMWDPLYYGVIARRPGLYLAFHGFAAYIGVLTVAPILAHVTTAQTYALASASIALFAMPSLLHLIDRARPLHWLLLFGGAAALGGLSWSARPWVPPATLWVENAVVTDALDEKTRTPGVALFSVSPAQLHAQGLYAYTAIHAPRGLREQVFHRWLHDGAEVDRIALEILGGREEGYRAWSYKRGFPREPQGRWRVEVVTDGGQLIGEFEFEVVGAAAVPTPAREPEPAPEPEPQPEPNVQPEAQQEPQPELHQPLPEPAPEPEAAPDETAPEPAPPDDSADDLRT